MHPHDYYAPYSDEPRLHNRGEGRPYVEPDWQANAAGHQLPVLSTIGRGPRGEGLTVGNIVNNETTSSFGLYSTLTGELVWQSPNLHPGTIEFIPTDFRDLAAGQAAPLDIMVTRGGVTETTHAYLPCGEQGSLIYVIPGVKNYNTSQTYQAKVGDLTIYNNNHWNNGHRPLPRVNDIVIVKIQQEDTVYLAVGDIVQVGSGVDHSGQNIDEETQLVYVVRTMIDNVGPKGDKGDPGEPGEPGEPGRDGIDGDAKTVLMSHAYQGRRISMIPEIADEVAEYDNEWEFLEARMSANNYSNLEVGDFFYVPLISGDSEIGGMLVAIADIDYDGVRYNDRHYLRCVVIAMIEHDDATINGCGTPWFDANNPVYEEYYGLHQSMFYRDFVNGVFYSELPPTFLDLLDSRTWIEVASYKEDDVDHEYRIHTLFWEHPVRPLSIDDVYGKGNPYTTQPSTQLLARGHLAFFDSHSLLDFFYVGIRNSDQLDDALENLKIIDDFEGVYALGSSVSSFWFCDVGYLDGLAADTTNPPKPIGLYQSEGYGVTPIGNGPNQSPRTLPWSITFTLVPKTAFPNYNNVASISLFDSSTNRSYQDGDEISIGGQSAWLRVEAIDENGNAIQSDDCVFHVYTTRSDVMNISGSVGLSFENTSLVPANIPLVIRSINGVEAHFTIAHHFVS